MRFEKKAIIFDLDGVVCTTDRLHYRAWKILAGRLGIYFDEAINDRLRGVSRMACVDIVLERAERSFSPEEKEALAEEQDRLLWEMLEKLTPGDLEPEVRDTLQTLRARGYKLALGSSNAKARLILDKVGLGNFFDAVADGTDIARAKPDPEVFLTAAARLGENPADCAVVEDAEAGIRAARAGGMTALALFGSARGCGLEDYDLTSFADLLNLFP